MHKTDKGDQHTLDDDLVVVWCNFTQGFVGRSDCCHAGVNTSMTGVQGAEFENVGCHSWSLTTGLRCQGYRPFWWEGFTTGIEPGDSWVIRWSLSEGYCTVERVLITCCCYALFCYWDCGRSDSYIWQKKRKYVNEIVNTVTEKKQ